MKNENKTKDKLIQELIKTQKKIKDLEEISQNKDTLYDPEVVDVCLKLFKKKEFKF